MNENIYDIKEINKDTWSIIDEKGEIVATITKEDIVNQCKKEIEEMENEHISSYIIIDFMVYFLNCQYGKFLRYIDHYTPHFEKFVAWYNYLCVEVMTQELLSYYKQQYNDFE